MARFSQGIAGPLHGAQARGELPGLIELPPQVLRKASALQGILRGGKGLFGHRRGRGHAPFLFVKLRQAGSRGLRQRWRCPLRHRAIEPFGTPWIPEKKGEVAQGHTQTLTVFAAWAKDVIGKHQRQLQRSEGLFHRAVIEEGLGFQL